MATAKAKHQNLIKAKDAKQDEFYTQLSDIEKELKHYKKHFKGKVVYCNCDDPEVSNFFRYFFLKFNELGLRKLITTCYRGDGNSFSRGDSTHGVLLEYDGNRKQKTVLEGDGDFRSPECVELLEQADVVVTNPPFSLFREFVEQLIGYGKRFIIVGNKNAITYKEIFGLIKENRVWVGVMPMGFDILFDVPEECARTMVATGKEGSSYKMVNGVVKGRSPSIWFTNLDIRKRHEKLVLYEKYALAKYPAYDNYDAIEVGKVKEIPMDYTSAMGVPVTFLDKYNPEQFEIMGSNNTLAKPMSYGGGAFYLANGDGTYHRLYARIVIKRKENQ